MFNKLINSLCNVSKNKYQKSINNNQYQKQHMSTILSDDIIYEVMKWLDDIQIISKCFLISQQWYRVGVERVEFTLAINNSIFDKLASCNFTKSNQFNLSGMKVIGSIGDQGCMKFSNPIFSKLQHLQLDQSNIFKHGAVCFEFLTELRSLSIRRNFLGPEGARLIGSTLVNLTELNMYNNYIGDEGMKALCSLSNLIQLNVNLNKITDIGVSSIGLLRKLDTLEISGNSISEEGAKLISTLSNLTFLNITTNSIGSEGAKAISLMNNLKTLRINSSDIGLDGIQFINSLKINNATLIQLDE